MIKTYGIQPIDDGGLLNFYIDIDQINNFFKKNNLICDFKMGGYAEIIREEIVLTQLLTTSVVLPAWEDSLCVNNPKFYNKSLDCWFYIFKFNENAQNIVKIYTNENIFYDEWRKQEG